MRGVGGGGGGWAGGCGGWGFERVVGMFALAGTKNPGRRCGRGAPLAMPRRAGVADWTLRCGEKIPLAEASPTWGLVHRGWRLRLLGALSNQHREGFDCFGAVLAADFYADDGQQDSG